MYKITHLEVKPNFILHLTFANKTSGDVSLADRLFGPMFEPLRDPNFFAQAELDEFGTVYWPNGADLAPDALYQKVKVSLERQVV